MREQDVRTRHINRENRPQRISIILIHLLCRRNRILDQPSLARDTDGVEDEKGIVSAQYHMISRLSPFCAVLERWTYRNHVTNAGTPFPAMTKTKYEYRIISVTLHATNIELYAGLYCVV